MIPRSLVQISFFSDLDFSNNNLTGPIPSSGKLATFPASSYENNRGLCGIALFPCGYHPETYPIRSEQSQNGKNHSILRKVDWIWVIVVLGYIFDVAIGVVLEILCFETGMVHLDKAYDHLKNQKKQKKLKDIRQTIIPVAQAQVY
ncbi:hypothetical protein CRYUN_Cryun33cG0018300 [Craigia yunnanensis]